MRRRGPGQLVLFMIVALAAVPAAAASAAAPVATTGAVSDVTSTSATFHGTVDPGGEDTQYTFTYAGKSSNGPTLGSAETAPVPAGEVSGVSGPTDVSVTVDDLATGANYYVALQAQNGSGSPTGSWVAFATRPGPPSFQPPLDIGDVTDTTAFLDNSVYLSGVPTWFHYEYGTTTSYGLVSPAVEPELDPDSLCSVPEFAAPTYLPCWFVSSQPANAGLAGLAPGTTYHVRLVAHNEAGTAASPDATFTTTGTPPTPVAPPAPPASSEPTPPAAPHAVAGPRFAILTTRASVHVRGGTTSLVVACEGAAGSCRGSLSVVVSERRRGHRPSLVTLAHAGVDLRAGSRRSIALRLDRAGLRLIGRAADGRLRAEAILGTAHRAVEFVRPS